MLFLQGFCPYGEHNRMADILFKTPEGGLHAMLHAPLGECTMHIIPCHIQAELLHILTGTQCKNNSYASNDKLTFSIVVR